MIEQARATLTDAQRSLGHLLKLLEERLDAADQRERELAELKRVAEIEQRQFKESADKREAAKMRELERKTEEMLEQFEARARETIDRLSGSTDQRKFVEHSQRKVAQAGREMRQERDTTLSAVRGESTPELVPVIEGTRVRLRGVREPARVRRLLANGILEVEAGFMKLQVAREDVLEVLPDTPSKAKLPKGVTVHTAAREAKSMASIAELNVIGRRAEEALAELDKALRQRGLGRRNALARGARPWHGCPEARHRRDAGNAPARCQVLRCHAAGRRGAWTIVELEPS